ncbi:glycerophosphoryl diester phosphodiesterase [Flavobacterium succinicans]|uniref:Glycerophosphoryl diester phosphodiesterase n=1 Tax=Flavobacterium succinicans TaxID=29536 RepID=A0A1I4X876_9FLAO|nr:MULTISPECIES: glycerophosphodiester phosphodiesterase family protein [Flavobacterium]OOV27824.1 glycerophosphodiester phosphodiesterase [Flavobacterium sp. LM5]SFN22188.1 glycerophosphoryl diester phosphodiesterase [Flavobacterium succinicans]
MKYFTLLGFCAGSFLFMSCSSNQFLVCGHRGAMGHETENTLASVGKAVELKADMLEIDVFKIKSGELVVFHDNNLERLTGIKGKIEDFDFKELRELKVAGKHQIPTLQEVIEKIDKRAVLNIELKGEHTAVDTYKIIESYLKKGWKIKHFFISSFRVEELQKMRNLNRSIAIGLLVHKDPIEKIIATGKELQVQAINPNFKFLNAENVAILKANNFKIFPWTVNNPEDIAQMKRLKVSGVITDFPERSQK